MAKTKKNGKYAAVHKIAAGIWLLAFFVIVVTGFEAGARMTTILTRAVVVTLVVTCISRIVISIFATSEEINGS